ncbi:hypothetical protein SPAN111604_11115 [Sphingomonas antarctica]|uniref:hypothetical protein n=1 Tax=Sphingomonas antarctica TaxID=2040274 RepID=UPI0039E88A91
MTAELKARETAARIARERIEADVDALLGALAPASLVRDGIDEAKARAKAVADDAADFVKERPLGTGAVLGGAVAIGVWKIVTAFRETRKAKKR